jgi:hypothetical protein
MLLWSRNQRRVNDLTAAGQIPLTKQLGIQTIEKGLGPNRTNTILEVPHRRTIRNVGRRRQAAKALKAQSIQQLKLNLLVRQIVQPFKHQNPNHGLSPKGLANAFGGNHSRGDAINFARQCRKVHDLTDLDQRITQAIDFRGPGLSSKQITFDCTAWLHHPASD